jgi:uncharacterized damage-inducible protein DinB
MLPLRLSAFGGTDIGRRSQNEDRFLVDHFAGLYTVADGMGALTSQVGETLAQLRAIPESRGGHRYAEGKWSIRESIGHMADTERVFAYRAVRFARNDSTALPGFDENAFVANASFDQRSMTSLIDEFEAVRRATIAFFGGLAPDEMLRRGTASGHPVSVRALAWITAGHELHHREILNTRYLSTG